MITTKGIPPLKDPGSWSADLLDFREKCLKIDTNERPSAADLLKHPFLAQKCTPDDIVNLVIRAREAAEAHENEEDDSEND